MDWNVQVNQKTHRVKLPDQLSSDAPFPVEINGRSLQAKWHRATKTLYILDPKRSEAWLPVHSRSLQVQRFPGESEFNVTAEFTPSTSKQTLCLEATVAPNIPGQDARLSSHVKRAKPIRSQITGKVLRILVKVGDKVGAGDPLLIVEAMKMENRIVAIHGGKIESIKVSEGDTIAAGTELILFKS